MNCVTEDEARQDGFENLAALRAALERHYSRISDTSWVTVIGFEPVGGLVSSFEKNWGRDGC
jgi:hypothetical protein